jgi:hypothetical protein
MNLGPVPFGTLGTLLAATDPYANLNRSIALDGEFSEQHREVVQAAAEARRTGTINLLRSAGPVSDAFIMSGDRIACIVGPQGSGKTIASQKKGAVEAQRIRPGSDGVRRYVLGVFRQLYDSLWKATIPSWWKIFPRDLPGSQWTGASPRAATQIIRFQDSWGLVEWTTHFLAFGETADPENLRGLEFTDVLLPEVDTLPPDLLTWLIGRIGRNPPAEVTGRQGRIWSDMNAPDVLNWTYKTFYENRLDGYALYRQPGGLDVGAENLESYRDKLDARSTGREYYIQQAELNAANDWWIKRMIHGIPGMSRATDLVYEQFDERTMLARSTIKPEPLLPVIAGIDGGLTPAAVYVQERGDGQLVILGEIALARGGMDELGAAMLAYEAWRFPHGRFGFVRRCDPSMLAGEDSDTDDPDDQLVSKGSDRQRLAAILGDEVLPAITQQTGRRWDAVRAKIRGPWPPLLLDPSCIGLLRGFLQTYALRKLRGTNDLSSVQPTFDTHVHDALQYAALECGGEQARKRRGDIEARARRVREENRNAARYNPMHYARGRGSR